VADDTQTRITESMEEHSATARAKVATRRQAIGAGTVTVLNGSPVMAPDVPSYPGQRQICNARTAGTLATPITTINAPGAFSGTTLLRPGESLDPCSAFFRVGEAGRPATNVPFQVRAYATDRYGNVLSPQNDTIWLSSQLPAVTLPQPQPLVNGLAVLNVVYHDYGADTLMAAARRVYGQRFVPVGGVTRTWTAAAGSSNWQTGGNWAGGGAPMQLDSAYIPAGTPHNPTLSANAAVRGVVVENGASILLGPFDLTAAANVATGSSGGIESSSGRLVLVGIASTVHGVVPRLRVFGTYTLSGNLTARAPLRVEAGRLRAGGFRIRASSF
jgi:hypothetical protein